MRALKDAEKKAAEQVEEARMSRVAKMKTASSEAQKMINKYRDQRQADFDKENSNAGSTGAFNKQELESTTARELAEMQSTFKTNKDNVVSMLVGKTTDVKIDIPKAWGITTKR